MKKVFSPHGGVFGHDTTYIRRMTLEQYRGELRAEAAEQEDPPSSQTQSRSASRHEAEKRTHTGLSSRNPNVVFSSKYPVYNRLGRELCVAHQSQDMMVQQELRRLEEERQGGLDGRRSGVRLSAELPLGSDGTATTRPCSVAETQPPSLADDDDREYEFSPTSHRLVRASHVDEGDSAMDVTVSVTSNYPSVSASRTSSRPVSARPSEFSIFRESAPVAAAGAAAARKAYSSVPIRTMPAEEKILVRRAAGVEGGQRATSMPFSPGSALRSGDCRVGSTLQQDRGWRLAGAEKRPRSRSAGDRLSRVRFVSEADGDATGGVGVCRVSPYGHDQRMPRAVLPPRPATPPPLPMSEPTPTHLHDTTQEEVTRWTTLARNSAAMRATKQLFRPTAHSVNSTRTTTTLGYPQPISSNLYGLTAPTILASKVQTAVEQNVLACTAAMPQHYTQGFATEESGVAHRQHVPELCCGSVVQLGDRWFRLVHFYVVAEVYEAVCVEAPAVAACEAPETNAFATPTEESRIAGNAVQTPAVRDGDESAQQTPADPTQQFFLYRWRSAESSRCLDEARRAALGFSLYAPHAHVTGFNYADGGGVTLVAVPAGHHAVPVSALPLSLHSYTTLLRTVLKTLSAMVAHRTIHGNLEAMGELFLLWPTEASSAPDNSGEGDAAETKPREPCVLLFHWERWVDFGMFMDRNAGRTVSLDLEDNSAQPLVSYGKDLLTGLQLFLEHPLAAQLTSEQYILLQKLVVLAAEPTSVANHLIQLNNLMLTLPADTAALEKSVRGAVVQHMNA